jgi:hypothetical protein
MVKKFGVHYKPGCSLAIDEALIGFKGQSSLKQCMPEKPTKWGTKAWVIAGSKRGYLLDFKIYLEKEEKNLNLLLGEKVVLNMSLTYTGLWHHIYFDNFFTSHGLIELLSEIKTNARATRDVLLLSTNTDPRSDLTVSRKSGKGGEEIEVPCPRAVENYTENMADVDMADQMRAYYGVGHSSKKWWKYIFHFIMTISIVNNFIIFYLSNRPARSSHGNRQHQFRQNLVTQLIGNFTSQKRVGATRSLLVGIPTPQVCHTLEKIQRNVKKCVQCATKKIRTLSGHGKQSASKCKQCDISLCCIDSFLTYHQERDVQILN